MKYTSILSVILSGLLIGNIAVAGTAKPMLLAQAASISAADLGVEDPGLLPTNPFYFFKELGRGILRAVTFDPVAKAALELRIVNEKAAEASRVAEVSGTNADAVLRALTNYRDAQIRLKERFDALAQASQNPNIDALVQNFSDKAVKHELLFDSLAKKFDGTAGISDLADSAKGMLEQSLASAGGKEAPGQFAAALDRSLRNAVTGELKNSYAAEILDRIREKLPEDGRQALDDVLAVFEGQARQEVRDLLSVKSVKELQALLDAFPDSSRKQDLGAEIFNKQKQELGAPKNGAAVLRITPEAQLHAEIVICDQVKKNLQDLWDAFKAGSITSQEYAQKNDVLKEQDASCAAVNASQASTTSAVPVRVGDATVCTQEYDPVCGIDNKTYSNECVAKASGAAIQSGGECKSAAVSATTTLP